MLKRVAYLTFLLLLLYLIPSYWVSLLRNDTVRSIGPLGRFFVRQNAVLANAIYNLRELPHLEQKKEDLELQVVQLEQKLNDDQSLQRENQALRQELGVTGVTHNAKKLFAHVTLQGSDPLDRTFTVDVGSQDGVRLGQPAVYQGSLVGRVVSVRASSSVIRSVTSQQSNVQAWIADSREKGLLVGTGSGVILSEINQGVSVSSQSLVETSGLGGSLPQGILIGQLGPAQSKQSDLSQTFAVHLAYEPTALESLFILLTDSQ